MLLPTGMGFAAGAMLLVLFSELVPDARENLGDLLVGGIITASLLMRASQLYIQD